jgi:transcriptional regulator with GAF, ATPase, and Fis domain
VRQAGVDSIAARVLQTGQAVLAERDDRKEKVSCLAVPLRTEQQVIGVLGIDAKPAHVFDQNDSYQLSILANFAAVALGNAKLIAGLKDGAAIQTERADAAQESLAPGLADSVAEARRLSAELRHLADSVQALADKLQHKSQ